MAQIRLVPSSYSRSSTSYVTVTNADNMYYNTDHTSNYATLQGRTRNSNTAYYAFIGGFNFNDVPSNATVNSFTIKIRAYRNSAQRTGTNFRLRLTYASSSGSVISNTTLSSDLTTSANTYTFPNGSMTWDDLKGYQSFSIEVPLAGSSGNTAPLVYVYGAEILVDYTAANVAVTGVTLDQNSASIEVGETLQLTETVAPSNATNKTVSWSSSNTSVATVSGGLVTGVSAGSATITVTTADGNKTATCAVTVTPVTMIEYVQTNNFVAGNKYLIVNGNTGSVYVMSNESAGSGQLKGVSATISNGKLLISQSNANKCEFTVELDDSTDTETIWLKNGTSYLYSDSSNHLRMDTARTPRYWHYKADGKNLLWFFNGTSNQYGYTDTSSTYKYYLQVSNGNFSDAYVSTTSLENTNTPSIYLFIEYTGSSLPIRVKQNGEWVTAQKLFVKQNGSWIQSTTIKVKNNGTWK